MKKIIPILLLFWTGLSSAGIGQGIPEDSLSWRVFDSGLDNAVAIYATSMPSIFIVEQGKNRVLKYAPDGIRTDSIGNLGFGNYQFDTPTDIDATNGLKIYVADYNNRRIQVYDKRFQYLTTITHPAGNQGFKYYSPKYLSLNSTLELFFYDESMNRIVKYNMNGERQNSFDLPMEGAGETPNGLWAGDEEIYLIEKKRGLIHAFAGNGQRVQFWGGARGISGIIKFRNHFWLLFPDRIAKWNSRGTPVHRFKLPKNVQGVDLAVTAGKVYLLTPTSIYVANRID